MSYREDQHLRAVATDWADAAITVTFTDGTEKTVTVNRDADGTLRVPVSDGVAHFGRDDGDGWREFFAAPLANIKGWGW